ncbi:DUF3047 domain-containing protein [bacterium]|nr:DUF3047 domain-containing protein [bacterium]
MKKIVTVVLIVGLGIGAWWMTRASDFDTGSPLAFENVDVSLLDDLDTDNLPDGWVHRKFLTVAAADYDMVQDDGQLALRCTTDASASIFARDTEIPVADLPVLSWEWKVTQPIESDIDEATEEGDDHPVRLFLVFSNEEAARTAMEIIWSNKKFAPGDYKIIGNFHHYVANGLDENVGRWHSHSLDLREIYADIGGTGTPTLQTLGFFCDSDNTASQSEGLFRNVTLTGSP